jgi:hypothetical protein
MYRALFILLFFGFQLKGFAQSEPAKKPAPTQVQSPDQPKKAGISSASRRSALPTPAASKVPKSGEKGVPAEYNKGPKPQLNSIPDRTQIRVPKAKSVGPITRPGTLPRPPRTRPPGAQI